MKKKKKPEKDSKKPTTRGAKSTNSKSKPVASSSKKPATKKQTKPEPSKAAAPKKTVAPEAAPKKPSTSENKPKLKAIKHSDKDEMTVDNLKPIVIKPKPKKRLRRRELKRVAKVGGYTVFDGARAGKTFATREEANAYAAEQLLRTGELYDVAPTDRHVTHTFKPTEQTESK